LRYSGVLQTQTMAKKLQNISLVNNFMTKYFFIVWLISLTTLTTITLFYRLGSHDYLIGVFGIIGLHFVILGIFGFVKLLLYITHIEIIDNKIY
jgi:hypothetical protein